MHASGMRLKAALRFFDIEMEAENGLLFKKWWRYVRKDNPDFAWAVSALEAAGYKVVVHLGREVERHLGDAASHYGEKTSVMITIDEVQISW